MGRKAFTTKKKTKHKHKYEKLSVLNYYQVEGATGKNTRKHCPQCGPAFHMAQHYDRHYCGFCHLTLRVDKELAKQRYADLLRRQAAKKLINQLKKLRVDLKNQHQRKRRSEN